MFYIFSYIYYTDIKKDLCVHMCEVNIYTIYIILEKYEKAKPQIILKRCLRKGQKRKENITSQY